jgi:hypothetical protein
MSCSAATGSWSSLPCPDVADMRIDGYVCRRGTVLIYMFDQELHLTVCTWMRRYDEREGGFLLGKGHARTSWRHKHRQSPFGEGHFRAKRFWCDEDDARCCNPDSHKCWRKGKCQCEKSYLAATCMAGETDKHKNVVVGFYSGKKGSHKITKRTNVWLNTINISNPYLLLSLCVSTFVPWRLHTWPQASTCIPKWPVVSLKFTYCFSLVSQPAVSSLPRPTVMAAVFLHHHHPYRSLAGSTSTPGPTRLCISSDSKRMTSSGCVSPLRPGGRLYSRS